MNPIRIASRGSKLALVQAEFVKKMLIKQDPTRAVSIVVVSTKGDRDKSDFLYKSQSVGFFTSEVENALIENRADLAVHSLKDLPTATTPELHVAAIPLRESPSDAVVTAIPLTSITDLPKGSVVGTSSLRRISQLLRIRPDLKCVPLRGNVETRLSKVESGNVDAAVVACAGLNRLGLSHKISLALCPAEFVPAPAQGALALQVRKEDKDTKVFVEKLDHWETRIAVETERHILATMKGGCSIPLGVYSKIEDEKINIYAILSDLKGINVVTHHLSAPLKQASDAAEAVAAYLLERGGRDILAQIRSAETPPDN